MKIIKQDIIAIENKLLEGIKTSNVKLLDSLLFDGLLFMAPNGIVITKEMDLASHREGGMVVEKLIPTIEDINISGETAVVVVVYDTRGTMLGKPIAGKFRYLRIWKLFDDGLKVVAGSCYKL